jgi:hypothetical protein
MAGSHIDIAPTLIELCAPKGTPYFALGHDMLHESLPALGIGRNYAVDGSFIWNVTSPSTSPEVVPGVTPRGEAPDAEALRAMHGAMHGIAWWRIKKGAVIP